MSIEDNATNVLVAMIENQLSATRMSFDSRDAFDQWVIDVYKKLVDVMLEKRKDIDETRVSSSG